MTEKKKPLDEKELDTFSGGDGGQQTFRIDYKFVFSDNASGQEHTYENCKFASGNTLAEVAPKMVTPVFNEFKSLYPDTMYHIISWEMSCSNPQWYNKLI